MDALEQHRVVSVIARPSSWSLAGRHWLHASKGVRAATAFNANEGRAAYAAEPAVKLSANQPLATAGMREPSNCAAGSAPIQYP
jgi:hypothetical protein